MRINRVFPISAIQHGYKWRELADNNSHIVINARWLKRVSIGPLEEFLKAVNCATYWDEYHEDMALSDYIVADSFANTESHEFLIGIGMAIGMGRTVLLCGHDDRYGRYKYASDVVRFENMDLIMNHIRTNKW